jgi:hypothetical protein
MKHRLSRSRKEIAVASHPNPLARLLLGSRRQLDPEEANVLDKMDRRLPILTLMLSTLAAIQAPAIMMSQNRQATKDRVAASLDYEVNLRTEFQMLRLHDKIGQAVAARLGRIERALGHALHETAR